MPTASISPVDLAKRVAAILRIELTFTKPPTDHDKQLYDELPLRSALSFSTEGGISAAKASFAAEISDEDAMKHLFCMVHGEFVPSAGMDVDHAFAHSQIRERQDEVHREFYTQNYAMEMSTSAPTDPSLKEAVGSFPKNALRYKETEHSYAKIRDLVTKRYGKDFADGVCPATC